MQDEPQTEDISFVELRGKLMRLAYRMLGSAATSEDVVQEAWIKWTEAGKPTPEAPLAYFSKIVTRICLDHLRKVSTKREKYVGSWLPEPVVARWSLEQDSVDDIAEIDISYALMMVMERLSPLERAAYLLHDLFEVPFAEISDILERSPATCRKLATRARGNIARAEKRHNANEVELGKLLNVFLSARQSGDISGLAALLSDTVIFYSDGGGKMPAALNPIYGREKVVRFLQGLADKFDLLNRSELKLAHINGSAAFIIQEKTGELQSLVFDLDDAGQIATFYTVRNPDKLQALT